MAGVSPRTRIALWTRAAGRCEFRGCNKPLLGEAISGNDLLNGAYVAHIVGEKPTGPRGDLIRSPLLADDVKNLMLLCDLHHRTIDGDEASYPVAALLAMKQEHEARIEAVTAITPDMATHVLLYAAKVGEHDCPARFDLAKTALLPRRYPAERQAIHLDLSGVDLQDSEAAYWMLQQDNIRRQFAKRVRDLVASGEIKHLSVFALAPQPLLIELGRLLGDIAQVEVHQLHREPQGWDWRDDRAPLTYTVTAPSRQTGRVALKLALSATVTDERIEAALPGDVAIWSVTIPEPHNDVMHRREDLAGFRQVVRQVFDRIKATHGESAEVHVFPALPVSAAVEVGRVWMPKADLSLVVYDQDHRVGGFIERLSIGRDRLAGPSLSQGKETAHA